MGCLGAEAGALRALRAVGIEPVAVCSPTHTGRQQHVRIALQNPAEGEAAKAIAALFKVPRFKHVFIFDDDIDPFDDRQAEWALSTRFRADRDLTIETGFPPQHMDITMASGDKMTKLGFDCTLPRDRGDKIDFKVPRAPRFEQPARFATVREALAAGPLYFAELMEAVGSRDGREVSLALDALREEGVLERADEGQWRLLPGAGRA